MRRVWGLFALFLIVVGLGFTEARLYGQQPDPYAYASNDNSNNSPPALDHEKRDGSANNSGDKAKPDWWLVGLTGVLAFMAIVQTLVFARQAQRLRETIEAMGRIDAKQGERMNASITETRRIGEAQVRAYVGISKITIQFQSLAPNVPTQPIIELFANNSGLTPARGFLWTPTIQYASGGKRRERGLLKRQTQNLGMRIPANGELRDRLMIAEMSASEFAASFDPPSARFIVRVRVEFEFLDVFDKRIEDETYFSGLASNIGIGLNAGTWVATLEPVPRPSDWGETQKKG